MKKRQTIKNIKRVSCRFDMDIPEERRAWQILQRNYQEPPDGKKQAQEQTGIQQNEEIINDAALDFMDSFMG